MSSVNFQMPKILQFQLLKCELLAAFPSVLKSLSTEYLLLLACRSVNRLIRKVIGILTDDDMDIIDIQEINIQ